MANLEQSLDEISELLEEKMEDLLPEVNEGRVGESRLARAMRYSAMAPGKRLRPFLVVASAGLFGVSKSAALQVAAAVEFIHCYSLIHDDLPAIDNDDMRRGQPSCHKKFDEATAILAGDALFALAFEVISHPSTHSDNAVRAELTLEVAKACGAQGMVGGQIMDLISEERELDINEITRLQRMKTGALFAVSCESGAILGKAAKPLRNALRGYAHDIGLAFQITDDLLDAVSLEARAANAERQDKSSGKGTYVSALGVEKAQTQVRMLTEQAIAHLHVFGRSAKLLEELAHFVVERKR